MSEIQPIPVNRLFTITFVTAIFALFMFSQVIAEPSADRAITTNDLNDGPSITNGENAPGKFEALDESEINVVSRKDTVRYYLLVSASSVFTAAIVGLATAFGFVYYFNSSDIKEFVNNAFQMNGMETTFGSYGKHGAFFSKELPSKSEIQLFGLRKTRVKIILPTNQSLDPREFGLRDETDYVSTICDIDLLPLRLRVVSEYLKELSV